MLCRKAGTGAMWAALFGLAASAKTCGEAIEGLSAPKVGEGHDFFTGIALQMLARAERLQSANAPLGDEDCPVKLAERSFCEDCPESRITVLWSIPGSGNTFTRTLVEASTLIHTGSKYYDRAIARKLPGELENVTEADSCSRLSVIKMHGNTDACCGQFLNSLCDFEAKHAIFLIRHPISASWAEFQRKLSSSHTAALVTASSASMQQAPWFPDWEKRSQKLLKYWGKTVHEDGQYGMYAKVYGDASYTILRFEDLVDPSTREVELKNALDFAGLSDFYTDKSIACAFNSQLSEAFHRESVSNDSKVSRRLSELHIIAHDEESSSAHKAWMALDAFQRETRWAQVSQFATLLGYTQNATERTS